MNPLFDRDLAELRLLATQARWASLLPEEKFECSCHRRPHYSAWFSEAMAKEKDKSNYQQLLELETMGQKR